jgi:hypothetical protein
LPLAITNDFGAKGKWYWFLNTNPYWQEMNPRVRPAALFFEESTCSDAFEATDSPFTTPDTIPRRTSSFDSSNDSPSTPLGNISALRNSLPHIPEPLTVQQLQENLKNVQHKLQKKQIKLKKEKNELLQEKNELLKKQSKVEKEKEDLLKEKNELLQEKNELLKKQSKVEKEMEELLQEQQALGKSTVNFEEVNGALSLINNRLASMDQRLASMDQRLVSMDHRLEVMLAKPDIQNLTTDIALLKKSATELQTLINNCTTKSWNVLNVFKVAPNEYGKSLELIHKDDIVWFRSMMDDGLFRAEKDEVWPYFMEFSHGFHNVQFPTQDIDDSLPQLIELMLNDYFSKESERRCDFLTFWTRLTNAMISQESGSRSRKRRENYQIDAFYTNESVIFEFKGDVKGCSTFPLVQLIAYYARISAESRKPRLLVLVVGPTITVFGGIWNDNQRPAFAKLYGPLVLDRDATEPLARVIHGVHAFSTHSESLSRNSFTSFPKKTNIILYNNRVIKFSHRYDEHVHAMAHRAKFAPELYNIEVYAGGFLLEMEYLEGYCTLEQIRFTAGLEFIITQLEQFLSFLSNSRFVHGDLRAPNIMVNLEEKSVKIIDFDWAGRAGVSVYPLDKSKKIKWHKSALPLGKIEIEHDSWMVREILKVRMFPIAADWPNLD